jgi:hypothetical protein
MSALRDRLKLCWDSVEGPGAKPPHLPLDLFCAPLYDAVILGDSPMSEGERLDECRRWLARFGGDARQ